ncbi:type I restriction-modification system subunit M [Irregularibacter muris]|uniref:site-specific DNA-methyltransferase (adenine-specific) n=1 Tax=Irregularibacter muris TaxID=1796619 RepID=A0AAE3HDE5_9FIRM|nr:class I SAM-dependent DNA methyltransferase [Irregularibacter muris]MCR1897380.1 type I restriction-modification system subunit M [Irregularibacter muris]
MVTGELKNKVDKIWEIFWTGGITNPLSVIEQFTYLLFIKGLDDKQTDLEQNAEIFGIESEKIFKENHQGLRWKNFKQLPAKDMHEVISKEIFPFIKTMHGDKDSAFAQYMDDAIFMIPTPQMLEKIVTNIDTLPLRDRDANGDLYEYLLSKVATAGTNGQFRTPRHIIKMMVELMKPTPTDIIIDPAAGTAGFLVAAGEYLQKNNEGLFAVKELRDHYNKTMFHGNDMDRTMLRIGAMNMMLHGVENPNIEYRDSLSESNKDEEEYTLVLANPPFKGSLDYDSVSADLLKVTKTKKTELLFLSLFLRILKKGGRCASIVPDGVLFGSSQAHKAIRKEIVEKHHLHGVISMPSGVFKPYAGVSTAILLFTKTGAGGTDKVWFYDMKADGYSLDDKRQPIEENDIQDIIKRYHNRAEERDRKRTEQSFFVDKEEIVKNDYDLSINRYKEIEYEEVEYEEPKVIIGKIKDLEQQILQGLEDLERMV